MHFYQTNKEMNRAFELSMGFNQFIMKRIGNSTSTRSSHQSQNSSTTSAPREAEIENFYDDFGEVDQSILSFTKRSNENEESTARGSNFKEEYSLSSTRTPTSSQSSEESFVEDNYDADDDTTTRTHDDRKQRRFGQSRMSLKGQFFRSRRAINRRKSREVKKNVNHQESLVSLDGGGEDYTWRDNSITSASASASASASISTSTSEIDYLSTFLVQ